MAGLGFNLMWPLMLNFRKQWLLSILILQKDESSSIIFFLWFLKQTWNAIGLYSFLKSFLSKSGWYLGMGFCLSYSSSCFSVNMVHFLWQSFLRTWYQMCSCAQSQQQYWSGVLIRELIFRVVHIWLITTGMKGNSASLCLWSFYVESIWMLEVSLIYFLSSKQI